MEKKQIIPFLVLVVVTAIAAYIILGASDFRPLVETLTDKSVTQTVGTQTIVSKEVATTTSTTTATTSATTSTRAIPAPLVKEQVGPVVTDFFSCIDVTGTILESYPRQCVFNGETFMEQIKDAIAIPGDAIELTLEVGPEKVTCQGLVSQECLVVDGANFYNDITGFEHEEGYRQTIKVSRTLRWGTTDPAQVPADAGLYAYELVEVLSKVSVEQVNNCVVAGCSSHLCISKEEQEAGGGISTCEFREEYACYQFSECREQSDGQCGWTMTPEVTQCLENPPTLQ